MVDEFRRSREVCLQRDRLLQYSAVVATLFIGTGRQKPQDRDDERRMLCAFGYGGEDSSLRSWLADFADGDRGRQVALGESGDQRHAVAVRNELSECLPVVGPVCDVRGEPRRRAGGGGDGAAAALS